MVGWSEGSGPAIIGDALNSFGVFGLTPNPGPAGVFGLAYNTTGLGTGVRGEADLGQGVLGIATNTGSAASTGVMGLNSSGLAGSYAIEGQIGGDADAIFGFQTSAAGTGMAVIGLSNSSNADSRGVFGFLSGDGFGVQGGNGSTTSSGSGVSGFSSSPVGMGGRFSNADASGTGLLSSGNNILGYYLTVGAGVSGSGTYYGVTGYAVGSDSTTENSAGGYFQDSLGVSSVYVSRVAAYIGGTNYKIIGNGTVSTIVKDENEQDRIMFAPEAPEALLEDYGHGQLVNGKAKISLDAIYAKNIVVNNDHALRVFVQLEGDCNGVYVTNKTGNSFEVKELAGGASNVNFTYKVIGNRADDKVNGKVVSHYESLRFPAGPKKLATKTSYNNMRKYKAPKIIEDKGQKDSLDYEFKNK